MDPPTRFFCPAFGLRLVAHRRLEYHPRMCGFSSLTFVPFVSCFCFSKTLIEITRDDCVWVGATVDERLRKAHTDFIKECRKHRVRPLLAKAVRVQWWDEAIGVRSSLCSLALYRRGLDWPRKHLYPSGKSGFPTIVQKHLNGAATRLQHSRGCSH